FNNVNQRAFGYDMFSEPVRRKAMESARDNGVAVVSGKVTLIQELDEKIQPGFLMYLPLYNRLGADNPQDRRKELIGYVYSPFRMYDLMSGILGEQLKNIKLNIYDDFMAEENLLYSSETNDSAAKFTERTILEKFKSLNINGRNWVLQDRKSTRLNSSHVKIS